jgi:hypothetical protein
MDRNSGWIYCIFNTSFKVYGEHVYKLGRTNDLKRRLNDYNTIFLEPSIYVTFSERKFADCRKAEAVLFYMLRDFRVSKNREFFCIDSFRIRRVFSRLSSLSDDAIAECFACVLKRVDPDIIIEQVEHDPDFESKVQESIEYRSWLDQWFDKYRFRPKDPSMYPGYVPEEHQNLNRLFQQQEEDFFSPESYVHKYLKLEMSA